ncbi:MAG: hypothetical protein ABI818_10680 [Acidobacteriota bacterium]
MARGFESKSVEAQQDDAVRARNASAPRLTGDARIADDRRRTLELTRKRTHADLGRATAPAHRRMLEEAIAALDAQLETLLTPR